MPPKAWTVDAAAVSTSVGADQIDDRGVDAVGRLQLAGGGGEIGRVAIPQGHARPRGEQAFGDGAADALRAAGDDGASAGQVDLVHDAYGIRPWGLDVTLGTDRPIHQA